MLKKIKKYITNPEYRFMINDAFGLYRKMQDDEYLQRKFKKNMKRPLNLENPQTFNEKLQWLKLYDRKPEYTMMVDKYKVREYIAEKLGEEYLIPLLGVWNDPDEIDFDTLPNQFVLKCNHNSGLGMCICRDKSKLDIKRVRAELRKGLKQDYYLTGREWPYKNVVPKIIAEKYMVDSSTQELRDYKFFCFGGVCKCMKVDFDRFIEHRANYYDVQGNFLDLGEMVCPPNKSKAIVLPKTISQMKELAEKLSAEIPFLRVDFYDVNGKVYFGELTFFPASGLGSFTSEDWDYRLGEWIELPENKGKIMINEKVAAIFKEKNKSKKGDLTDYKFFCFNGRVDCVMVCLERSSGDTKFYFFDKEWNLLRYNKRGKDAPEGFTIPKPSNMDEMFDIAEKLSEGLPFSRIDLYSVEGKTYFGEITFFPDSGFDSNLLVETDQYWGDMIDISKVKD